MLQEIIISNYKNSAGHEQDIALSYQFFGKEPGTAPIVLVNHALSGNSEVTGKSGWWKELIGEGKCIDTRNYTILAFNMPGNGFDGKPEHLLQNHREFSLRDIAKIYAEAIEKLGITSLFAGIGGSIGGALLWELAVIQPKLIKNLIPVATDFKATHWVKALCKVQDQILNNSAKPLRDARMQAMTFYRSPQSFTSKFGVASGKNPGNPNVESWLEHHGQKLEKRFELASYKLMNHLLTTIDISNGNGEFIKAAGTIESDIHIVTVNSDRFFLAEENWEAYVNLALIKENISIHEIDSIHGHDAFLIETSQIAAFLTPIFNSNHNNNETDKYSALWSR